MTISACKPPVLLVRLDKGAIDVAALGKNHQGWHYGFKLHVSIDYRCKLAALYFTSANEADAGYTAKVTSRRVWRNFQCYILSSPRPKQKWLMEDWQHKLLQLQPKIESTFSKLKKQAYFVTSFP